MDRGESGGELKSADDLAAEAVNVPAPTVSALPLGDELSLFDARTGTAITLNRTAADVFALSDGQTRVSEIVGVLARAYAVEPASIEADVIGVVRELIASGVLVTVDAA